MLLLRRQAWDPKNVKIAMSVLEGMREKFSERPERNLEELAFGWQAELENCGLSHLTRGHRLSLGSSLSLTETYCNCQFLAFLPVIYTLPDNGQNVLDICASLRKGR